MDVRPFHIHSFKINVTNCCICEDGRTMLTLALLTFTFSVRHVSICACTLETIYIINVSFIQASYNMIKKMLMRAYDLITCV